MTELLQQLINGLSLGAIYALIALGYTLVYGVLRFINFAHSDVFMVGAFLGYYIGRLFPEGSLLGACAALVGAMLGCALLGMLIERLAYRRLRPAPTLNVLITAIGVSLLLEYTCQLAFGATPRTFPAVVPASNISFAGLIVSSNQLLVIGVAFGLMMGLRWVVHRTRIGTAMRALSMNPRAASLVGINNDVIIALTFGIGSALAGAGGVLYAINYPSIDPLMGVMPGLKAFVSAVLGGIGSIPGAAFGGLLLGSAETAVAASSLSTYKDAIAFGILILVLLFRPTGLLGRNQMEKV